jgi:DNA invertase Pin-like site-specific DNA recombinase
VLGSARRVTHRLRLKGDAGSADPRHTPEHVGGVECREQRYQAVLAVIRDGVSIAQLAHRLGVSRQPVHRWLRWYEDQGLGGLVDRSHRPPRCSH